LAARAAEIRKTAEEVEIEENCGCVDHRKDLFLPNNDSSTTESNSGLKRHPANQSSDEGDSMDVSYKRYADT
jgi:hypothetical protein